MTTPLKREREQCYAARDLYWSCLDHNNNKNEKCKKFRAEFENFCSKQWVKHFDRKRKYEKFKETMDKDNWEMPAGKENENK